MQLGVRASRLLLVLYRKEVLLSEHATCLKNFVVLTMMSPVA